MFTRSTITLSRTAFNHNVSSINAATGHGSLALVVKSNAYGHGMLQMAKLGQEHPGVSWLCTVGVEEALYLRKNGVTKPLMVMSFLDDSIDEAIKNDIHLNVNSFDDALSIDAAAQRVGRKAQVHVNIDTGLGRLGLLPGEAVSVLYQISTLPTIELYGIKTHLSDTGHADHSYSKKQLMIFDNVLDEAQQRGITFACSHAQSSSSLDLIPKRAYSFVRVGASAFGLWKSEQQRTLFTTKYPGFTLRPVLEWRAKIIQLKEVPTGSYVGYKRTYKAARPTRLAMVPIGYWDGYAYSLSNKGCALLNNQQVPVAGLISMNITTFDVTDVPNVNVGDELVLLGNASSILPHEIAQQANSITNQVTTLLHSSIERTIVENHQS